MKNEIRLFLIILYVLFIESLILSCIATPILLIPSKTYLHDIPFGLFVFFTLFFVYKCILESWIYFLTINIYSHFRNEPISKNTLINSRYVLMVVIAIITFVSLIFEKETKVGVIGGTILAPVVYIAHAAIPYLIFKNH